MFQVPDHSSSQLLITDRTLRAHGQFLLAHGNIFLIETIPQHVLSSDNNMKAIKTINYSINEQMFWKNAPNNGHLKKQTTWPSH